MSEIEPIKSIIARVIGKPVGCPACSNTGLMFYREVLEQSSTQSCVPCKCSEGQKRAKTSIGDIDCQDGVYKQKMSGIPMPIVYTEKAGVK